MVFWKNDDEEQSSSEAKESQPRESAPPKPPVSSSAEQSSSAVRSALGKGTVIQGKLSFDTPVRIDGNLSGEVFSSDVLIVGPSGEVDAEIDVAELIVYGRVKGVIKARVRVELKAGASLEGDLQTAGLAIETGAHFNGTSKMGSASARKSSGKASASVEKSAVTQSSSASKESGGNAQGAQSKDSKEKTGSASMH